MPTFKVQGQVYHQIGSLLPISEQDRKFLEIYFMDNVEKEIDRQCTLGIATDREIISQLRTLFHEHNCLVGDFKSILEDVRADDFKIIIRADKASLKEMQRRLMLHLILKYQL